MTVDAIFYVAILPIAARILPTEKSDRIFLCLGDLEIVHKLAYAALRTVAAEVMLVAELLLFRTVSDLLQDFGAIRDGGIGAAATWIPLWSLLWRGRSQLLDSQRRSDLRRRSDRLDGSRPCRRRFAASERCRRVRGQTRGCHDGRGFVGTTTIREPIVTGNLVTAKDFFGQVVQDGDAGVGEFSCRWETLKYGDSIAGVLVLQNLVKERSVPGVVRDTEKDLSAVIVL